MNNNQALEAFERIINGNTHGGSNEKRDSDINLVRQVIAAQGDKIKSMLNYTIDLQRIIESICHDREIVRPITGAMHHYNMALEYRAATRSPDEALEAIRDVDVSDPVKYVQKVDSIACQALSTYKEKAEK